MATCGEKIDDMTKEAAQANYSDRSHVLASLDVALDGIAASGSRTRASQADDNGGHDRTLAGTVDARHKVGVRLEAYGRVPVRHKVDHMHLLDRSNFGLHQRELRGGSQVSTT